MTKISLKTYKAAVIHVGYQELAFIGVCHNTLVSSVSNLK
jgi:hypothetical protein